MAEPKPDFYIDWATQDETSPSGNPNKVDIPVEFQLSGLKEGEPVPRPYFNQQLNLTGEWIRYLEDQIIQLSISASAAVINTIYPVGALYITDQDADPSTILGVGTWERIEGRFLVGRDLSDTDFDGIGETGGSKTHTHSNSLSADDHALTIDEIPNHSHTLELQYQGNDKASEGSAYASLSEVSGGDFDGTDTRSTNSTGSSNPHGHNISGSIDSASSLPPYHVTNVFRRIA